MQKKQENQVKTYTFEERARWKSKETKLKTLLLKGGPDAKNQKTELQTLLSKSGPDENIRFWACFVNKYNLQLFIYKLLFKDILAR